MEVFKFDPNDFPTGKPNHDKDGYKSWLIVGITYMQHPNGNRYKMWESQGTSYVTDYQTGHTSEVNIK
jgi:hypothetical protein